MNSINTEINQNKFSYEEFWQLQEPMIRPHKQKAEELGLHVDDIPVSPVLTIFKEALRRLEHMYNLAEIEEQGFNVREMLSYMTEQRVIESLEEQDIEQAVTLGETEALLIFEEWQEVVQLPKIKSNYFDLRQFEEGPFGEMIDVSAFNTMDFLTSTNFEFDKYRYFLSKTEEKAKDIAIMHSVVSTEEAKQRVKQKFISLVNNKFRNYALRLAAMIKTSKDGEKRAELLEKLKEQNKQIRRLKQIWKKYAYIE